MDWALSSSSSNSDSVDDKSLLGLVSESSGLVRTSRVSSTVDSRQLSIVPCSNSEEKSHNIRLLLLVQLLNVFVGT